MRDIKSIRGDMFAHGVPFELVQELEEAAKVASDVDEVVCDVCGAKAHIFEGAPCTACHEGFMRKPVAAPSEEKALAVLEDFIHASKCARLRHPMKPPFPEPMLLNKEPK